MAMNGSFAGGLADGLRNGMAISQAWDAINERNRSRQAQKDIASQMLSQAGGAVRPGDIGLEHIRVGQHARVNGPQALGDAAGLTPIPIHGQADQQGGMADAVLPVGSQGGSVRMIGDQSAGGPSADGAGWGKVVPGLAMLTGAGSMAAQSAGGGVSGARSLGMQDHFGNMADGLMRAYTKALELGELDQASKLLIEHERYASKFRDRAYSAARSRYDLTGDPSGFVGFVNQFTPGGIEARSIEKLNQTAGGAPLYMFKGYDPINKKEVSQPITQWMLDSYVQAIGDPEGQKAMFAKQYQDLQALNMARQKAQIDADAKVDVRNRTHSLDMEKATAGTKGQVVDTPNGVVLVDPKSGTSQPVKTADGKQQMGAKHSKAVEDARGSISLGQTTVASIDRNLGYIDRLLANKKGLDGIVGAQLSLRPTWAMRDKQLEANADLDSIKSKVVLNTMNDMRAASAAGATGFGNMSNQQLKVIEDSLGSLSRAQTMDQITANLQIIRKAMTDMRGKAQGHIDQALADIGGPAAGAKASKQGTDAGDSGFSNLWGQ